MPTFSDTIAAVRRELWKRQDFDTSLSKVKMVKMPRSTPSDQRTAFTYIFGAICPKEEGSDSAQVQHPMMNLPSRLSPPLCGRWANRKMRCVRV